MKILKGIESIVSDFLLKYVFPQRLYCMTCGAVIDYTRNYSLCDNCIKNLNWASVKERKDVYPFWHIEKDTFDDIFTCMVYGKKERKPILQLKHTGATYLARELGEIMSDRLAVEIGHHYGEIFVDMMIPIPLHPKRMKERGYNQAELLALEIQRRLGIPVEAKALARIKNTEKTKEMSKEARAANIQGAFMAVQPEKIKGKSILVIDDVFTTGATACEAAKILRQCGAREVYLLTIAAGVQRTLKEAI